MKRRKVFLDIGGHHGQSSLIALHPKFGFDKVFSFEPSNTAFKNLFKIKNSRFTPINLALSNKHGFAKLYNSGSIGATMIEGKNSDSDIEFDSPLKDYEVIKEEPISNWISANLDELDLIYMKINCEGCEVYIIEDLIKSGFISRVSAMYVDFDIRKFPRLMHLRFQSEQGLNDANAKYMSWETLQSMLSREDALKPFAALKHWLNLQELTSSKSPLIWIDWYRTKLKVKSTYTEIIYKIVGPTIYKFLRQKIVFLSKFLEQNSRSTK